MLVITLPKWISKKRGSNQAVNGVRLKIVSRRRSRVRIPSPALNYDFFPFYVISFFLFLSNSVLISSDFWQEASSKATDLRYNMSDKKIYGIVN